MTKLFDERRDALHALRRWERIWKQERVFAAAWRCYAIARNFGFPIPASVLDEFDRIAWAFENEIAEVRNAMAIPKESTGTLAAKKVGEIVTQTTGRGSTNPAKTMALIERDLDVAGEVALLRYDGESENTAVVRVAADGSLRPETSPALVRGAVKRAKRFWPDEG